MRANYNSVDDAVEAGETYFQAGDMLGAFLATRQLSELKYVPSYAVMGWFYETGNQIEGVQLEAAYQWYEKAALEGNSAQANLALGRFYLNGMVVQKDVTKGLLFLELAYSLADVNAGILLGYHYVHGVGVAVNLDKAEEYLVPASIYGYPVATALRAKIAFKRGRRYEGTRLYLKSLFSAVRLQLKNPNSGKLYLIRSSAHNDV